MPFPLYPSMLHESFLEKVRAISKARLERIGSIKTRQAAVEYVSDVRNKVRKCFGPLPRRTPLNLRIVREDKRDGYTRQNIIFESRPGYLVSGNLYIPSGNGKVPAVLGCCGHSLDGKAEPAYQAFCIGLVRLGYIVLIADPVSQGERWQYAADDIPEKTWLQKRCTYEHNTIGKTQSLVGEFFGTWRVWDKMRALDVLLSHPRADVSRVGVTGNSGGGTLSSYIFALDERIKMAAPGCYITSFLHNLENALPCDAEQMIPGILKAGLEMGDLLIARAPAPVMVLSQKYDFFDIRGADEVYEQARRIYGLLGKAENFQWSVDNAGHGYSQPMREAMYRFFNKQVGIKALAKESILNVVPEKVDQLHAADGDVNKCGSKLSWEFTAEKARQLKAARPKISKQTKLKQLKKLLHLPPKRDICHYRCSQLKRYGVPACESGYHGQIHYLVETQPGTLAVLCRFMGKNCYPACHSLEPEKEMELFIPNKAADMEVDIEKGTVMGKTVKDAWILEPRGMGNTMPQSIQEYDFDNPYGLDYMYATTCDMLGESLMGLRVHDVLCALDILVANSAKKISLTGRGLGAIIATFAGALHNNVVKVNMLDAPPSYFEMTQKPITKENTSYMVKDILKYFDWPDFSCR